VRTIASIIVLLCSLVTVPVCSQDSVFGKWKTIDDKTGQPKSIVEIFERNGRVYGRIVKLFREQGEDLDPICDKCSPNDPRHKQKIIGMEILRDMTRDGESFANGQILDPEVGKVYRCKIWVEGSDLKVRGYLGPFWRTQTWKKAS
jgi:uncharacterized protein (DUF2147 family)